jgi:hypothetical protein
MTIYTFDIPALLNGEQLLIELDAKAVYVVDEKLVINSDKTETEVTAALAAHVPAPFVEPTVAEKLSSVGLSVDDLKAALAL